jgi:pyridoxamine 5'-phosphate oxidase
MTSMPTPDPISEFIGAIERANARGVDTTPVALATADANGRPSVRMVLLRGIDERGFVFHTNYKSRKAREIEDNPYAALCFHWPTLEEQIRIEGAVERLTADESDDYFAGRPRESQLGAWASAQSEILASREKFEEEYGATETRFHGQPVPRPPFWGGYRIAPSHIEFWYGRTARLHDRILYLREGSNWTVQRLYP